jgi:sulfate adenylyltransferase
MLTEGEPVPEEFSRSEVLAILREYYAGLREKVGIDLHVHATGNFNGEK